MILEGLFGGGFICIMLVILEDGAMDKSKKFIHMFSCNWPILISMSSNCALVTKIEPNRLIGSQMTKKYVKKKRLNGI